MIDPGQKEPASDSSTTDGFLAHARQESSKTGFPLELRVAKVLQTHNSVVDHSVYFVDRDEGVGKELDIRAFKHLEFESGGQICWVGSHLFVECKRTADKHWVVFTSERTPNDPPGTELPDGPSQTELLHDAERVRGVLRYTHPFSADVRLGRSSFELNKNQAGDQIFRALTNSVKACVSARTEFLDVSAYERFTDFRFHIPVIVFDGKLLDAHYEDGGEQIEYADEVLFAFTSQSPSYKALHRQIVPVVRGQVLPDFLKVIDHVLDAVMGGGAGWTIEAGLPCSLNAVGTLRANPANSLWTGQTGQMRPAGEPWAAEGGPFSHCWPWR
jgi:hypothetical protein